MKQWTPVVVHWFDSCGADHGWQDPHDLDHEPVDVQTIGFMYKYNAKGITVVSNRNDGLIGGFTYIPAVNIVSVTRLVPSGKSRKRH